VLGTIDHDSDRAVYRQIADQLRGAIERGEVSDGERLPSESALMRHYGVARMTVRQALRILQAEGLVVAQHGRGVFVRARQPVRRVASSRFSREARSTGLGAFAAEMARLGRAPRQEMREIAEIEPPAFVAERLGLGPGERVLVRRRRMFADDVPLQLADSYVPASIARGTRLYEEESGPGGTYARIEEQGHRLMRAQEELQARLPSAEEQRLLRLTPGLPVVHLVRTVYDTEGVPVEVFDSVVNGEGHVFVYDVDMD
jgi:GntR family transcriptional regulator